MSRQRSTSELRNQVNNKKMTSGSVSPNEDNAYRSVVLWAIHLDSNQGVLLRDLTTREQVVSAIGQLCHEQHVKAVMVRFELTDPYFRVSTLAVSRIRPLYHITVILTSPKQSVWDSCEVHFSI